jgi:signal transduction histidine kinase
VEEELSQKRDRLRELSRRLVEVQEEERRAIARELHDRAGQTLSALNINLLIMNQQLPGEVKQTLGPRLEDSMKLTADAISLIRNVMSDLRPAVLDDYGLQAALKAYAEEYTSRYGIQVQLHPLETDLPQLAPGVAMTILRIVQEALTNVARHAQAERVQVSMRLEDDMIHLSVQDNGIGIGDVQAAGRPDSHGLKIMRERAEAFGGTLKVGPAPERGTQVEATIPIQIGSPVTR